MTNIIDDLKWRYAVKKFDPKKKISDENLAKIKECLVLTPSSFGLQPWKFIIVKNPKTREILREHSWGQSQITDASHLIVLCTLKKVDEDFVDKYINLMKSKSNRSAESFAGFKKMLMSSVVDENSRYGKNQKEYFQNQVHIALGNLLTTCAALKIDTCAIGGFDPAKYDEILGLAEKGLESCVVCPIGYRSTEDAHQNDEKIRFNLEELVEEV